MSDIAFSLIDNWAHASAIESLQEGDAHVWMASLDQPENMIARLTLLLSQDERRRAERYHYASDCRRFIAGRGILRKIISAYLALPPEDVRFIYNEYGKPFISAGQNRCGLNFSLSHSNGMALYVVARGRRVGIDIEHMREDLASLEIAERFFSKDEGEALRAAPIDQRTRVFFNCWSRKESYIKAIGMGVSYPLDGFTVSMAPGAAPALLNVDADANEAARWKMYELEAAEGYAAALIVENPPASIRRFRWQESGPEIN